MLTTPRRRALAAPLAAIGAAGALLIPLALEQASHRYAGWIGDMALSNRFWQLLQRFAVGTESLEDPLRILIYTVLGLGVWLLLARASGPERRGGLLAGALGLSVIALPLALRYVGVDYFFYRNQVAAVPLLAVGLGAGFGARKAGWAGLAGATTLGALSVAVLLSGLVVAPERPPADWRDAAKAVGAPTEDRATLMLGQPSSPMGPHPLDLYLSEAEPLAASPGAVREIAVVEQRAETTAPLRAAGGFRLVERRVTAAFVITRLRARRPVAVPPEALALRQPGRRITHGWLQRRGTPGAGEDRPPALGRSVL